MISVIQFILIGKDPLEMGLLQEILFGKVGFEVQ
jgi:hypothetical protein